MNDTIKRLTTKYPGLNTDELNNMNPEYSCVICGNMTCPFHGTPKKACPDYEPMSTDEYISNKKAWESILDFAKHLFRKK